MRLATYVAEGREAVGVVVGREVVDISGLAPDMLAAVSGGDDLIEEARSVVKRSTRRLAVDAVRLAAPFPRPRKNVLCLGLNYRDHIAEADAGGLGAKGAVAPVWFTKAVTSICGPYEDLALDPGVSEQFDWEVELAVVIGRPGRRIAIADAMDHVHSYTVFNDVSARDVQGRHGGQFFKGKSIDRSSPMGPWLVTRDEIPDPTALALECRVNGIVKQSGRTHDMITSVPEAIADISEVLTLEAGDIISMGTPPGVGFARRPPEFLRPGDVLETEIDGIGSMRNAVTA